MGVSIRKETAERIKKCCTRGEKHDNFVNRLIDACIDEEKKINLSEETIDRLLDYTGCNEVDEALNELINKYKVVKKLKY